MSDRIIVYASKYGSTRRYAEELGMLMGVDVMNYRHIRHLNSYGEVICMGAIFAGRVLGLKKTMRRLSDFSGKRVSVITVGLADLHNEGNVSQQVPDELFWNLSIFHLRGAADYAKLSLKHRSVMRMLHHLMSHLPNKEIAPAIRLFMETYNRSVDFVDLSQLIPIKDDWECGDYIPCQAYRNNRLKFRK